jgi:hypothetical protein
MKIHVILDGAQRTERNGVKNLGGFKGEILRCGQKDKNSLLIARWYEVCPGDLTPKFFCKTCLRLQLYFLN